MLVDLPPGVLARAAAAAPDFSDRARLAAACRGTLKASRDDFAAWWSSPSADLGPREVAGLAALARRLGGSFGWTDLAVGPRDRNWMTRLATTRSDEGQRAAEALRALLEATPRLQRLRARVTPVLPGPPCLANLDHLDARSSGVSAEALRSMTRLTTLEVYARDGVPFAWDSSVFGVLGAVRRLVLGDIMLLPRELGRLTGLASLELHRVHMYGSGPYYLAREAEDLREAFRALVALRDLSVSVWTPDQEPPWGELPPLRSLRVRHNRTLRIDALCLERQTALETLCLRGARVDADDEDWALLALGRLRDVPTLELDFAAGSALLLNCVEELDAHRRKSGRRPSIPPP